MKDYEFLFKWKKELKDPSKDKELMGDIVKLVSAVKKEVMTYADKEINRYRSENEFKRGDPGHPNNEMGM